MYLKECVSGECVCRVSESVSPGVSCQGERRDINNFCHSADKMVAEDFPWCPDDCWRLSTSPVTAAMREGWGDVGRKGWGGGLVTGPGPVPMSTAESECAYMSVCVCVCCKGGGKGGEEGLSLSSFHT